MLKDDIDRHYDFDFKGMTFSMWGCSVILGLLCDIEFYRETVESRTQFYNYYKRSIDLNVSTIVH